MLNYQIHNKISYHGLLTTRQKTRLRNAFKNTMSTDMKLSKTQILAVPIAKKYFSFVKKNSCCFNN